MSDHCINGTVHDCKYTHTSLSASAVCDCYVMTQVGYNTEGWLNKNKDPINDSVIQLLSASKEPLVSLFFSEPKDGGERCACAYACTGDLLGLFAVSCCANLCGTNCYYFVVCSIEMGGATKKKKKGSAYQTISATHRVSLQSVFSKFTCVVITVDLLTSGLFRMLFSTFKFAELYAISMRHLRSSWISLA